MIREFASPEWRIGIGIGIGIVVVCVFLKFASPERETTILHQLLNTGPLVSNVSDFVFIQIALIVGAN